MPKYSVSSMFFHEYLCAEIFSFVEKSGCNAIEFWPETPDFWLHGKKHEDIKDIFGRHPGLESITIHAPVLDLNPCSVNPDVAEVSTKNTLEAIRLAEILGAEVVTIHPGRRTAKRPAGKRDMERFQRYIDRVHTAAVETGVKVALENMPPKINSLFSEPKQMEDILEQEEWLYFTFDIAHAITNDNTKAMEFINSAFDRIINIHISRNSGVKNHFPLDNDPFIGEIMGDLSERGYDGFLTLELEDLNLDRTATAEEKISIVKKDVSYIKSFFN
ncbi:sugar phosphate isomerase/epimerase family protein [Methanolacinia paynteri]|uniref:sugar phosphate isomerase/epimerase family protein n=1 Tax=Methanolacinia paynteri TaxID=230356 RepID=UPI00064F6F98|nr:sugar phosphate isomerase/epimerase family protein [Methanolacinia paynteri]